MDCKKRGVILLTSEEYEMLKAMEVNFNELTVDNIRDVVSNFRPVLVRTAVALGRGHILNRLGFTEDNVIESSMHPDVYMSEKEAGKVFDLSSTLDVILNEHTVILWEEGNPNTFYGLSSFRGNLARILSGISSVDGLTQTLRTAHLRKFCV